GTRQPEANSGAALRVAGLFGAAFVARSLQAHKGYARRSRLGSAKNSRPRRRRNLFVTVLAGEDMSNPMIRASEGITTLAEGRSRAVRRAARLAFFVLLIVAAGCGLSFIVGLPALGRYSGDLQKVMRWALLAAVTGILVITMVLFRMARRNAIWQKELSERLKSSEQLALANTGSLQNQIAQERLARERMEKQNATLAERNTFLE